MSSKRYNEYSPSTPNLESQPQGYQHDEKALTTQQNNTQVGLCCHILIAIIFPPIAVYLSRGNSGQLWLNIVLSFLIGFPGIIHALILVSVIGIHVKAGDLLTTF